MNASKIRRVWEGEGFFAHLLWPVLLPFSFLYSLGVRLRNLLYTLHLLPGRRLPCAIIGIGNLTVGGTGKTPTTVWLAQELGRRGYRVAILSRGYKRHGKKPMILEPGLNPSTPLAQAEDPWEAGDEPIMMARVFGHRVGVGKKRYEVGCQLLSQAAADVLLLDDGFQHRRLKRDLDILLLGSDWNGWLLPAGPFREPRSALSRADLFLVTGAREKWERWLTRYKKQSAFFSGSLKPKDLLTLEGDQWRELPLTLLSRSKVLAVCGTANPASFYRMIHDWGGEITDVVESPDHHAYSTKDWQTINRAARNVDFIVTTVKDIVKLTRFPFAREKLLALRVEMVVENGDSLVRAVEGVIRGRMGQSQGIKG